MRFSLSKNLKPKNSEPALVYSALAQAALAVAILLSLALIGTEAARTAIVALSLLACLLLANAGLIALYLRFRGIRESSRRMRLLADMNVQVNREILLNENIELIYRTILDYLFSIFNTVNTGSILILGDDGYLTFAASRGFTEEYVRDFRLKLEDAFLYQETKGHITETRLITSETLARLVTMFDPGDWEYNSVVSDGFQAVGTIYAIVTGLLVFGVFTTFQESTQQSADEASTLVLMYRNAQAFPQPQRDQAQQAVVAYINSVIDDEWPALADGAGSPKTSQAIDRLFDVYNPMSPDARWADQYARSVDDLSDVVKLRNELIDNARDSLPPIYWFLLFAGGFVTLLYLSLAYVEKKAMHALAVGLMAVMLGLVIFLLLEVNHPFRGEIAVPKTNFENALTSISQVTNGAR